MTDWNATVNGLSRQANQANSGDIGRPLTDDDRYGSVREMRPTSEQMLHMLPWFGLAKTALTKMPVPASQPIPMPAPKNNIPTPIQPSGAAYPKFTGTSLPNMPPPQIPSRIPPMPGAQFGSFGREGIQSRPTGNTLDEFYSFPPSWVPKK